MLNSFKTSVRKTYFQMATIIIYSCIALSGCREFHSGIVRTASEKNEEWRAVHLFAPWHNEMPMFKRVITEVLAPLGVNVLIIEVNYKYAFKSHPELREPGDNLTEEDARELAELCRQHSIRLIPEFNCLGHQSWDKTTFPLLKKYPELDETPDVPSDNKGIYCRSWCPLHPKTNEIVFPLLAEIAEAFQADAFHIGMDEVFLIASEQCPRCRGKDPAELFAKTVNDLYKFLGEEKKLTLLMWGDRLLNAKEMNYSEWEASLNKTERAIDMIPKDIIICDWHYGKKDEYLSVPYFQQKGFRVLPASWKELDATLALINYSQQHKTDKMLGHLFTTWYAVNDICPALLGEPNQSQYATEATKTANTLKQGLKYLSALRK
ncbi:MAG: family 20 glycosylhydrolase [Candidatus Sumerlaeia bacterium]|nr:family 20 glycosylhydrolase [Candidatus Sumerlaeia bacterium]